MDVKQDVDSA